VTLSAPRPTAGPALSAARSGSLHSPFIGARQVQHHAALCGHRQQRRPESAAEKASTMRRPLLRGMHLSAVWANLWSADVRYLGTNNTLTTGSGGRAAICCWAPEVVSGARGRRASDCTNCSALRNAVHTLASTRILARAPLTLPTFTADCLLSTL